MTFGARVKLGPSEADDPSRWGKAALTLSAVVQITTATHSTEAQSRRDGWEFAYPVEIGDDCWIGGGAIIYGPCKIGNGVTVAAGAVVRGDVPDNVVVGGVPAKILKRLEPPPPMPEA